MVPFHLGYVVLHGLSRSEKDFSIGWTMGHDDGLTGEALDSSLASGDTPFAKGYVDGYRMAINWVDEDEDQTRIFVRGTLGYQS